MGDWKYDGASINARWIVGLDGRPKVQLRLDLGVLQMEATGRPDGTRPHGCSTSLDFYKEQRKRADAGPRRDLTAAHLAELQQEAAQFYYRYIALYALGEMEGVIHDTAHNLQIIQFVSDHAESQEIAWTFQQFYPAVRMMSARARAEQAADRRAHDTAVQVVEEGLADIRKFRLEHGGGDPRQPFREVDMLEELRAEMQRRKPKSPSDHLREELERAIAAENYERAALLRDKLNNMAPR
jgi:hypothetical protein